MATGARAGRALLPALVFAGLVAGFALGGEVPWPFSPLAPGSPNPQAEPPIVEAGSGYPVVRTSEGAEWLLLHNRLPGGRSRLLWLAGRTVAPLGQHEGVVVNATGEILTITDRLQASVLPLPLGGRGVLGVARDPDGGVWVADEVGRILHFGREGTLRDEQAGPFFHSVPVSDPADGVPWFVRSTARFTWALPEPGAPLLVGGTTAGTPRHVGQVRVPLHAILADLANAGHAAVSGGRLFFAPFIRDELVAMTPEGDTLWLATRGLTHGTEEPAFEMQDGRAVIDYHPVNLGLVVGPNGHLYLLSTREFSMTEARLDEYDPASGRLLRTAYLDTTLPTLAADRRGRVYAVDPGRFAATRPPESRERPPAVDLPSTEGGRIRLADFRGAATLVNYWASWCGPCRREMPALDSLARELAPAGLQWLGLNDDDNSANATSFLAEIGVQMSTALGGGRLVREHGLPGLPVTLLLDAEGRVAARWFGELTAVQLREVRRAVEEALREMGAAEQGHAHHH